MHKGLQLGKKALSGFECRERPLLHKDPWARSAQELQQELNLTFSLVPGKSFLSEIPEMSPAPLLFQ